MHHGVFDDLLVGLMLLAAVVYAVHSLGPRTWRRRWLAASAALLSRLPAAMGLRGVGTRLGQAAVKPAAACGGCDTCGSEQQAEIATEVSIPLSKIGKRG